MSELEWVRLEWGAWRVRGQDGLIEVEPRGDHWRWRVYPGGGGEAATLAEAQIAALGEAVTMRERALAGFAALLVKTKGAA